MARAGYQLGSWSSRSRSEANSHEGLQGFRKVSVPFKIKWSEAQRFTGETHKGADGNAQFLPWLDALSTMFFHSMPMRVGFKPNIQRDMAPTGWRNLQPPPAQALEGISTSAVPSALPTCLYPLHAALRRSSANAKTYQNHVHDYWSYPENQKCSLILRPSCSASSFTSETIRSGANLPGHSEGKNSPCPLRSLSFEWHHYCAWAASEPTIPSKQYPTWWQS